MLPVGKVYLSLIVDCFDEIIVPWKIGVSPNTKLVNTMLDDVIAKLNIDEHLVVHSDRGTIIDGQDS